MKLTWKRFPFVIISSIETERLNRAIIQVGRVLVKMNIAFGIMFLLIGWRFGDWKNLGKYYSTILFLIIGDLLYNVLTYNNPIWKYNKDWMLANHTLVNLWIMITVYPATVITYLFYFPKNKIKQIFYILFWVILYFVWELLELNVLGLIKHYHGWNMWWSLLFDIILFVMLPIHHKRPLLAWGLSIFVIIFFLIIFDVNVLKLN